MAVLNRAIGDGIILVTSHPSSIFPRIWAIRGQTEQWRLGISGDLFWGLGRAENVTSILGESIWVTAWSVLGHWFLYSFIKPKLHWFFGQSEFDSAWQVFFAIFGMGRNTGQCVSIFLSQHAFSGQTRQQNKWQSNCFSTTKSRACGRCWQEFGWHDSVYQCVSSKTIPPGPQDACSSPGLWTIVRIGNLNL